MPTITRESDLEKVCINCGTEHTQKFSSVWHDKKHYKMTECENCSYKTFISTIDCSGID
ncbi:MAG: hypothetical protein KKF65_05815 [Nanoarchaeota archaeon]|nr:hypothetical protein [Nanoarchaeota archaeon]